MTKKSFEAIVPAHAKILILGSLPGDLSLERQEYYAHPRNRFWPVLFHIFGQEPTKDYQTKKDVLQNNNIALWDVCQEAERKGSMDLDIKLEVVNDIPELLRQYPTIKKVLFNGQKAAALFKKNISQKSELTYVTLPSTSPANASFSFQKLIEIWSKHLLA